MLRHKASISSISLLSLTLLALSGCGDDVTPATSVGTTTAVGSGTLSSGIPSADLTGTGSGAATTSSFPAPGTSSNGTSSAPTSSAPGSSSTQDSGNPTGTDSQPGGGKDDGAYVWLEDPTDGRVGDWIKRTNAASRPVLEGIAGFEATRVRMLEMVNKEPFNVLPSVSKIGDHLYSYQFSAASPRGVWVRTTLEEFKKPVPAWEPLLDVHQLAEQEKQNWVWTAPNCRAPVGDRCMITLMRAGANTYLTREFDTQTKTFASDGFALPEGPVAVSWIDRDNIFISANFGPGTTTNSGQPRQVRRLTRGQDLASAPVVFEVEPTDAFAQVSNITSAGQTRVLATRGINASQREYFLLQEGQPKVKLDVPVDASVGFWGKWLIVRLGASDWLTGSQTWEAGSVLVADQAQFVAGQRNLTRLYSPAQRTVPGFFETTKDYILLGTMENNKGRLHEWSVDEAGSWTRREVNIGRFGSFSVQALSHEESNEYLLTYSDFLTPPTMVQMNAGSDAVELVRAAAPYFDSANLEIQQHFAISKDGTRIPYFQVSKKGLELTGKNPTIVFGYGGFGVALPPVYRGGVGIGWLEKGGVYVLANIRGGGEFGPKWHHAAIKSNRQRSFDDFIAVGEHLVTRKVTSKPHMGAHGDGNGGLLAGVMLTQRPDLWGAVVSQNPVLDMQRFHVMPGGGNWNVEYGNPGRAEDLTYLLAYSPFHNIKSGVEYPPYLLSTRTTNQAIYPAHARKMMAKMKDQGHKQVYFYESTDTDQGGKTPYERRAYNASVIFSFFAKELGLGVTN